MSGKQGDCSAEGSAHGSLLLRGGEEQAGEVAMLDDLPQRAGLYSSPPRGWMGGGGGGMLLSPVAETEASLSACHVKGCWVGKTLQETLHGNTLPDLTLANFALSHSLTPGALTLHSLTSRSQTLCSLASCLLTLCELTLCSLTTFEFHTCKYF